MRAIYQSEHPSPDQVQEALTESMWEALAVAAAENIITAPTNREDDAALVRLGLLLPSGRPTAAGYALLLRWHRTHRKPRFPRSLVAPAESRHMQRMRILWGC